MKIKEVRNSVREQTAIYGWRQIYFKYIFDSIFRPTRARDHNNIDVITRVVEVASASVYIPLNTVLPPP